VVVVGIVPGIVVVDDNGVAVGMVFAAIVDVLVALVLVAAENQFVLSAWNSLFQVIIKQQQIYNCKM